jgi:hypothetical protein
MLTVSDPALAIAKAALPDAVTFSKSDAATPLSVIVGVPAAVVPSYVFPPMEADAIVRGAGVIWKVDAALLEAA